MQKDGPDKSAAEKASLPGPAVPAARQTGFRWPWGIVALAVMALAWLGIYLLWNGIVFLFWR